MKLTKFLFALSLTFAPLTVSAQDVSQDRIDLYISLIEEAGCLMTEEVAGAIMPANNYTRDESKAIVGILLGDGRAILDGRVLQMKTPACSDVQSPADILTAEFYAFMATQNCELSYEASRTAFPEAGFDLAALDHVVETLIKTDVISLVGNEQIITVGPELCK